MGSVSEPVPETPATHTMMSTFTKIMLGLTLLLAFVSTAQAGRSSLPGHPDFDSEHFRPSHAEAEVEEEYTTSRTPKAPDAVTPIQTVTNSRLKVSGPTRQWQFQFRL